MRSTPASRELGFVLAVALAGLVLVLAVAFTPWYSTSSDAAPGHPAAASTSGPDGTRVR
jgi:hypothetical protein